MGFGLGLGSFGVEAVGDCSGLRQGLSQDLMYNRLSSVILKLQMD